MEVEVEGMMLVEIQGGDEVTRITLRVEVVDVKVV